MSFVIVKYGANDEKLFNANCMNSVFLSHIKRSCGYEDTVENVDLATENGEVMDLLSRPKEYAKRYLEPRAAYILLRVSGRSFPRCFLLHSLRHTFDLSIQRIKQKTAR